MSFLKANAAARMSAPSPTPSNSSSGGAKRKRPDETPANIVYSQPQETGTGSHIYTQLTYAIEFLRTNQRWHTFKEIVDYLNVQEHDHHSRAHLQNLFRSPNPSNRIEYNEKTGLYRYRPKYDIRSAADLKGYLQNQKSAQGLPIKDLKDGWPAVNEEIKELENAKEVLVKRNQKDSQARTVWINDPSLMHQMDPDFANEWHKIQLPANPDDLRNKLVAVGLKPSSAKREAMASKPKEKKRKAPRRGGKQTNTHMANILKDFSHMRK
ncbi:hypothetical protein BDV95DRAFT_565912 [Massariosphaeria phaeospora]|uniref:Transcription initiation factor IIE subunit beta n=1 Tax=Massariosphaeria phaeospora TaxID=100035 RepID=A0A7C8M987_9PLEO|nr:hypothetical protein BDV95DRAFT_565912 [Massariosphaeria phaeospora]